MVLLFIHKVSRDKGIEIYFINILSVFLWNLKWTIFQETKIPKTVNEVLSVFVGIWLSSIQNCLRFQLWFTENAIIYQIFLNKTHILWIRFGNKSFLATEYYCKIPTTNWCPLWFTSWTVMSLGIAPKLLTYTCNISRSERCSEANTLNGIIIHPQGE